MKYKQIISQINYLALLLFVFWIPLKDDYLPAIMAVWIGTWLMEGNLKERFTTLSYKYLFWGLLVYFSFNVIYFYRANDLDYGWFRVQEKLSIVFFPIVLASSNQKIHDNRKMIFYAFLMGNILSSLFCLFNAFENSLVFENGKTFFRYHTYIGYEYLSFFEAINLRHYSYFACNYLSIFKHHAYFSMYITFAILIVVNLFRKKLIKKTLNKIMYIVIVIFFLIMLYLLQSRSTFIALPIVLICVAIIKFRKKMNKLFLILFVVIFGISVFVISTSEPIKRNFQELQEMTEEGLSGNIQKYDIRYRLWYTSTLVIKDNFWFGTSPANLTDELVKKYKELGFEAAEKEKLNAHNQYLETFAGMGIFGFLSLMFVIIYTFAISIRERNYLLFFLMLILSINFLFESMLNRMAGVLFMMFFLSVFTFMKGDKKTNEQEKLT